MKGVTFLIGIAAAFVAVTYALFPGAMEFSKVPEVIRIGVLPDENEQVLKDRYTRLGEYLAEQTGLAFELVIPTDYDDLVTLFGDDKIDLAYFGGLTFAQALSRHQAVPLVMREIDTHFTTFFLVRGDSTATSLSEFKGQRFSFGNRLSTSGHLMPRYFLSTLHGIQAETYFSEVAFSGTHDETAYRISRGEVDLGAANAQVIKEMHNSGRLAEGEIRVIEESPPYADYVWAVQSSLDPGTRIKIRDAFMMLDPTIEAQQSLLATLGATAFLPAGYEEFQSLIEIAGELGLLDPTQDTP